MIDLKQDLENLEGGPEPDESGLSPLIPITITGAWNSTPPTIRFKIRGPISSLYGDILLRFQAQYGDEIVKCEFWSPITDRRVARKIARKENMRFSKRDRSYVLRNKK